VRGSNRERRLSSVAEVYARAACDSNRAALFLKALNTRRSVLLFGSADLIMEKSQSVEKRILERIFENGAADIRTIARLKA